MIPRSLRACTASAAALAVAVSAAACGAGEPADEQERASQSEPAADGIAYAPTPEGALPAALLGDAPAPQGRDLHYLAEDSATRGYVAVPEGEGPFPSVILIHEWDGLNDRVRQVADALAAEGYVALAADLYRGRTGGTREENVALMTEVRENPEWAIENLNGAVGYLEGRDDVTGRVATIGWCFGGGIALSYALGGEQHDGTAVFYGRLVQDPEQLQRLDHEIYGTFAEMDSGIPPEQVDSFVEALRAAGVPNDVHVYDAVDHGFWLWVDEEPETRREPALDAWSRLKGYLDRALGGAAAS